MEKIFAEAPFFHRCFEILIGRGDDSYIHRDFAMPTQTVVGSPVQHAQQLDLDMRRQLADFVEKESSLVGQFKESGLGRVGAAESAFFIAKQFAFD